jgi:uncharacterized membrane protein
MYQLHSLNLAIHIGVGTLGILFGLAILFRLKGDAWHKQLGRWFATCVLVVCTTATLGNVFFRFLPLFAVLTVLASYQLVSGWRCAHTRQQGPAWMDAVWTLFAVGITCFLWPIVTALEPGGSTQPTVIYSSLASLAFVLGYDALRWLFPRRWFASLWLYEHVYKLLASFAALTSAFAGNVIRAWHPWSQILPSAVCLALIAGYFYLLTTGKWKAHQGQAK